MFLLFLKYIASMLRILIFTLLRELTSFIFSESSHTYFANKKHGASTFSRERRESTARSLYLPPSEAILFALGLKMTEWREAMRKAMITALWCALLTLFLTVGAFAQELLVGGQTVGIQVGMKGVLVAGLSQVENGEESYSPAENAGIKTGDLITELNGIQLRSAAELIDGISALDGKPAELTVRREDKTLRITVQPVKAAEGQWMLGMWLRDSISGIGTVTFCDPVSGVYGALGHSISDAETGVQIDLAVGNITEAEIVSISPGAVGTPGELNGAANMGKVLGSIDMNSDHGIFGKAFTALGSETLETGRISTGKANILSTVSGKQPEQYSVEINRVYHDAEGEHVMLTVTDPALTQKTGGIVQGMSGSPIIQNGKLVGAVTHVCVNQ